MLGVDDAIGLPADEAPIAITRAQLAGRAADEGLGNVTFEAADASTFQPEAAGFDIMVSRFGVMFFDDPTSAFAHIRSLMAPGGRLAFVCWQDLVANDWMIVPGAAVAEVLPLPVGDDPSAPGAFVFADANRTTGILTAAGFTDPSAAPATAELWMATTRPKLRTSCAPPVSVALCSLTHRPTSRRKRWLEQRQRWCPTSRPRA